MALSASLRREPPPPPLLGPALGALVRPRLALGLSFVSSPLLSSPRGQAPAQGAGSYSCGISDAAAACGERGVGGIWKLWPRRRFRLRYCYRGRDVEKGLRGRKLRRAAVGWRSGAEGSCYSAVEWCGFPHAGTPGTGFEVGLLEKRFMLGPSPRGGPACGGLLERVGGSTARLGGLVWGGSSNWGSYVARRTRRGGRAVRRRLGPGGPCGLASWVNCRSNGSSRGFSSVWTASSGGGFTGQAHDPCWGARWGVGLLFFFFFVRSRLVELWQQNVVSRQCPLGRAGEGDTGVETYDGELATAIDGRTNGETAGPGVETASSALRWCGVRRAHH